MKVCLVLTHQCNLACSYCYAGEKFNRHMSEDTAWQGLKLLLSEDDDLELSFFGGEPFLRFDTMVKVSRTARKAAALNHRKLTIQVTTNGTILEERHYLRRTAAQVFRRVRCLDRLFRRWTRRSARCRATF